MADRVVSFGADVVVDHVVDYRQTACVALVDKVFQISWSAERISSREVIDAVVAPIPFARRLRQAAVARSP